MTANTNHANNEMGEFDLEQVARRLLEALPPRMPQRVPTPEGCGWCGDESTDSGPTPGGLHEQADPAAWVLHVLREHLRPLLGEAHCTVRFNHAGGATVTLHDAYLEDVVLFRDTLGLDMLAARDLGEHGVAVMFGGDPYGREATMAWFTTPQFLRAASDLLSLQWLFPTPPVE